MVSGILWIPDLQTFMLHFNKIINFSFNSQVHKIHFGTMNPIEKTRVVMSKTFLLFRVSNHNRTML